MYLNSQTLVSQLKQIVPTYLLKLNNAPSSDAQVAVVPDIWASSVAETIPLTLPYIPTSSSPTTPGMMGSEGTPRQNVHLPNRLPSQTSVNSPNELFHFRARANSLGQRRGNRLSQQDFSSIEQFMKEFLAPKVFDNISSKMKEWEKGVASARRGISGRLFKVGLKYFGSSKPVASYPGSFTDPTTTLTIFPFNSAELIMRRLGDFGFMIR